MIHHPGTSQALPSDEAIVLDCSRDRAKYWPPWKFPGYDNQQIFPKSYPTMNCHTQLLRAGEDREFNADQAPSSAYINNEL